MKKHILKVWMIIALSFLAMNVAGQAPIVSTLNPVDGAPGVGLTTDLIVSFDRDIQFGSGPSLINIHRYDTDVQFQSFTVWESEDGTSNLLSISGNQLTISHNAFEEGVEYYVTIGAGSIESLGGVSFDGFSNKDIWNFTAEVLPVAPALVSFNPLDGATDVGITTDLIVSFDQDIQFGSGPSLINIHRYDTDVQFQTFTVWESSGGTSNLLSISGNQLTISHNAFEEGVEYYVTIGAGSLESLGGVSFDGFINKDIWNFTTEVLSVAPVLVSLNPLDGATDVRITSDLVVSFDQDIQLGSGPSLIKIYRYDTDVRFQSFTVWESSGGTSDLLSISGNQLTISHNAFEEGVEYYVTIGAGALESLGGVSFDGFSNKDIWNFTTEVLPGQPVLVSLNPLDGATDVGITSDLVVSFDQDIKLGSGPSLIKIYRYDTDVQFQTFTVWESSGGTSDLLSISGNQLTISHNAFEEGVEYYVTIGAGSLESLGGVSFDGFSNKDIWNFTTLISADPPVIIENGYSPAPGTFEVPLNSILTLNFDQGIVEGNSGLLRIKYGTADGKIYSLSSFDQISVSGSQLTIDLSDDPLLHYGTEYHVTIDPGFVKSSTTGVDFGGISLSSEWFFTTESAPPVWVDTYPFISDQDQLSFTIDAWADMVGTYYGVVTMDPAPPTIDRIKAGQNNVGSPARISFNEVVNSIVTASSRIVDFTSQTPVGDNYFLHVVYANEAGTSNSEVKTLILDRKAPTLFATNPVEGRLTFPIDSVLTISFNEPVVAEDGNDLTASYFSLIKIGTPDEVISFSFTVSTVSEITTVVLDPVVDLDENSQFLLVISPVYDLSGNISVQEEIGFETDGVSTWTGGGNNTSWLDENNWDGDGYAQFKSVLIPYGLTYYPDISSGTVDVHNLTIQPGAVLTHSGGTLNVTGMFTLQSSFNFNASYIHNGAVGTVLNEVGANVRVEQFINDINMTYLISSPTEESSAANFGNYYPLSTYNNTTDSWDAISSGALMDPGVGYRMWTDDSMVSFSGKINTGGVQVNLTRTDGQGFGWNLVGNPYPASIDWEQMGITESSTIEDNFWFWLPTLRSYGAYSASTSIPINIESSLIPSNHAFLVKVKIGNSTGVIDFMPSAQVPNDNNYLKSASRSKPVVDYIKLAGIAPNDIKDEMAVAFIDEASTGHDRFDLEKRFANRAHLLELFSLAGSLRTAINSFPLNGAYEIPLGFNALKTGDFAIEMLENNAENVETVLVDKLDDSEVRLFPGDRYDFTVDVKGLNTSRFALKFLKISTDSGAESSDLMKSSVFVQNKEVFVNSPAEAVGSEYLVYDFSGRFIRRGIIGSAGVNSLGHFEKGTYIINIISNSSANLENHKVVVY